MNRWERDGVRFSCSLDATTKIITFVALGFVAIMDIVLISCGIAVLDKTAAALWGGLVTSILTSALLLILPLWAPRGYVITKDMMLVRRIAPPSSRGCAAAIRLLLPLQRFPRQIIISPCGLVVRFQTERFFKFSGSRLCIVLS